MWSSNKWYTSYKHWKFVQPISIHMPPQYKTIYRIKRNRDTDGTIIVRLLSPYVKILFYKHIWTYSYGRFGKPVQSFSYWSIERSWFIYKIKCLVLNHLNYIALLFIMHTVSTMFFSTSLNIVILIWCIA